MEIACLTLDHHRDAHGRAKTVLVSAFKIRLKLKSAPRLSAQPMGYLSHGHRQSVTRIGGSNGRLSLGENRL